MKLDLADYEYIGSGNCLLSLQRRHNGRDGASNHQPHHFLLNRLLRRKSMKTSKLRVTGLCRGIHRWPVNSSYKWPVTRKMFRFDDVTMDWCWQCVNYTIEADTIRSPMNYSVWCLYRSLIINMPMFWVRILRMKSRRSIYLSCILRFGEIRHDGSWIMTAISCQ